jgi:hypothetical protein
MTGDFPPRIAQFIQQHIESLAQLETLLLLKGEPQRSWDAAAVAQALYTSPEECAANLAALAAAGFLEAAPEATRYRYCTDDAARRELIDTLQEVYRQRRVTVIELIYSKPSSRVQTFADAFRLRQEKKP